MSLVSRFVQIGSRYVNISAIESVAVRKTIFGNPCVEIAYKSSEGNFFWSGARHTELRFKNFTDAESYYQRIINDINK